MPFGRSKSLRSKRSNVGPTKEDNISTPRFVSTDAQPRSDLHLLRTSTLFPDGGPDIVPTPARTGDDLHLLRTSTLFPGGCPDLSSFGTKVNTERPRTADDRSGGDPIEQSLIRPRPAHQVSDPSKYRAPLQRNRSEPDGEEMVIGMALGDPEEDSSWTTKDQSPANHHSSNEPSTTSSTPIPHAERQLDSHGVGHGIDALKRKPSKWKTLGGIFGKRNISPASSTTQFHQIQHDSQPASHQETRITSHRTSPPQRVDVPIKTETSGVVHRGKGRNHRRKSSRLTKTKEGTRPDFRRARTAPQLHLEEQRQTPLTKDANADNTFPKLHLEGQPMLSVDLPDVQLDRYSIMFSGLLNPSLPSSLLVRRHAHLDNVKTDGNEGKSEQRTQDGGHRKPQRRATSPSHVKSPSLFSLFPSTPTQTTRTQPASTTSLKPSPLQRSHTTPGASSPNRATFERTRATEGSEVFRMVHTPVRTRPSRVDVRKCTSDAPNILHESTQTSADDCREEVRINGGPSEQQVESEEPASEVITTSDLVPNTVLISSTSDAKHEDLKKPCQ